MSELAQPDVFDLHVAEPEWKDLYRIGGIASLVAVVLQIVGIVAFFVWPYQASFASDGSVFATIREASGALMALDVVLFADVVFALPLFLALYLALRRVNRSYALIALAFGLIAVVSILPARPIAELVAQGDLHRAAITSTPLRRYLAAGDALLEGLNGTAWSVCLFFTGVSLLISSMLMVQSSAFSRATAYLGTITSIGTIAFFVQSIGLISLFTIGAPGGVIWCALLARELFRLGR